MQREIRQESKRCTHKERRGERRGETTKLLYLAGPLWGTKIVASGTGVAEAPKEKRPPRITSTSAGRGSEETPMEIGLEEAIAAPQCS